MKKLKILLSADWHMDSSWEALSGEQAAEMRAVSRSLPHRLAKIAQDEGADLILLAGDLFDSNKPYLDSARQLQTAFENTDIPVFIAPGNHDCFAANSPWESLRLPDNVYVFRTEKLKKVSIPMANIYGAAFTEPVRDKAPLFPALEEDGKFNILLLHADLQGKGSYMPLPVSDLAQSGFHFAALGHIHRPSGVQKAGNTYYCYPGCPMGRGFDECGDRGAMLITLTEDGCEGKFISLCSRRYEIISVPVTGKDPLEELILAVNSAREGDICRFELTGIGENLPSKHTLDALAKERGLYAAFLRDKTVPPKIQEDNSLKSALMDIAFQRMDGAGDLVQRQMTADALKWALAALEGAEAPMEVRK